MNPHPSTVEYIARACSKPDMFMHEYDLAQLEFEIHGYDSALLDAGLLSPYERFNAAFSDLLIANEGCSCSQGWAMAIAREHGAGVAGFNTFVSLLCAALPNRFQGIESARQ